MRKVSVHDHSCSGEVVERFEAHPEHQYEGRIGQIQTQDRSIKVTTDLVVSNKPEWKDVDDMLFRSLAAALREFRETFPYFKGPFKDEGYQVQRYDDQQQAHRDEAGKRRRNPALLGGVICPNVRAEGGLARG